MVKFTIDIAAVMNDPNLSITSSPFTHKSIIKRASFPGGQVPEHLAKYLITKGMCSGQTGTVVYKGKKIPKVAACVAGKKG